MTSSERQSSLLSLAEIADRLHYTGSDRERSVRRCFRKHGVPLMRRDRKFFATEVQFLALMEAMTCLPSEDAVAPIMSVARSVSGPKRGSSKSTLRAAIAEKMRTPIEPASKARSGKSSFTVLPGGRTR